MTDEEVDNEVRDYLTRSPDEHKRRERIRDAAPEMLEALTTIEALLRGYIDIMPKANDAVVRALNLAGYAIAKAEGDER